MIFEPLTDQDRKYSIVAKRRFPPFTFRNHAFYKNGAQADIMDQLFNAKLSIGPVGHLWYDDEW